MAFLIRASEACSQDWTAIVVSSEFLVGKDVFQCQVVDRIQFLAVVGLRNVVSC